MKRDNKQPLQTKKKQWNTFKRGSYCNLVISTEIESQHLSLLLSSRSRGRVPPCSLILSTIFLAGFECCKNIIVVKLPVRRMKKQLSSVKAGGCIHDLCGRWAEAARRSSANFAAFVALNPGPRWRLWTCWWEKEKHLLLLDGNVGDGEQNLRIRVACQKKLATWHSMQIWEIRMVQSTRIFYLICGIIMLVSRYIHKACLFMKEMRSNCLLGPLGCTLT